MAAAATPRLQKPKEEALRPLPVSAVPRKAPQNTRPFNPARSSLIAVSPTSSGVVDITSSIFEPSQAIADEIESSKGKGLDVRVIAKGVTQEGMIKVRQNSKNKYVSMNRGTMPLLNPWTQKLGGMFLNFDIENSGVKKGLASFKERGGDRNDWLQALKKDSTALGGLGLKINNLPTPVNKFENGKLVLGVSGLKVGVGNYLDASFDLLLENLSAPKIIGIAEINIGGAENNKLTLESNGDKLTGSVSLATTYKSFSGSIKVSYLADGNIDIAGKAAYSADKLSGEITFVATDEATANKFAKDAIAAAGGKENVQNAGAPAPVPVAKPGNKKRSLAATGLLNFNLTKWFAGTVNVVVDGKGMITVIGKIAPPGEIILFEQRDMPPKEIIKLEAKAYYGIPVVGNLNLFANISLHALAKLGPAKLYAIEILGTYSTDPEIQKSIQISGSLNISAYGGLRLRAEGGAGITILKHDLKFGIGLNADVGVKAYADARPTIGYRDPGIFYVSGTLDLVAQPILGLSGEFFIELDAPWFSPIDDDRWAWPLFSKEWPLGDPIGISASLKEYVLGSGKVPEITTKPPEFDPSKFMTNMVDDKLPNKSGGKGAGQGTFKDDGSVPKPVVPPKKPPPTPPAKPGKKGKTPAKSKSATPDAKAANSAKNTQLLEAASKPLRALQGKGAMTRGALDKELAAIRALARGVSFDVQAKGANWRVTPKPVGKKPNGVDIVAKGPVVGKGDQKSNGAAKGEKKSIGVGKKFEFKTTETLDMHGEGHTIFTEIRNGKLIVEMASGQRQALKVKTLRAISLTTNKTAIKRLNRVYDKLKKAEDEVTYLISDNKEIDKARALAEKLTREAADQLKSIGKEFGISDLDVIPHASKFVESTVTGYQIIAVYRKIIRSKFYPSKYETATQNWKRNYVNSNVDPKNPKNFLDAGGRSEPIDEATIDHQPKVVQHWEGLGGKNLTQGGRASWYRSHVGGHLSVVAKKWNSSDGAEARNMGLLYTFDNIGKDFRGPDEL